MNKRTRQKGEFVPSTMVPAVALTRLSAQAYYLLAFLLEHHETVAGPLDELRLDGRMRRAGLSRDGIRRASQELIDAGFYTYRDVRRADGTVARDMWVTEVPYALPAPDVTRRPVPAVKTRVTSKNASATKPRSVRPAETHPADAVSAGRSRKRTQDPLSVPPAETVPETDIVPGHHRKRPQDPLSVRPAEMHAGTDVVAGHDRKRPQDPLSVRPAETGSLDSLYAGQDGFALTRASSFRETDRQNEGNPPPSPLHVPGPRRHEEEGISISVGDARAWLGRLPFRSRIRPGTSLGPVVAEFLSAPGAWPREVLMRELCADLDTAKNVEAVLHSRLKALDPVYDPDEYLTYAAQTNAIVVQGERVPIDALKPAEDVRTAANDVFRQMRERERLRKAGAPEEESHGASGR